MLPKVTLLINSDTASPTKTVALNWPGFKPMSPVRYRDGLVKINIFWLNKAAIDQGHDG